MDKGKESDTPYLFAARRSVRIHVLIGLQSDRFLKEGVLPTTAKICIIRQGASNIPPVSKGDEQLAGDVELIPLPSRSAWLSDVALVDTPGTNAIVTRHEQLTQRIVPRSDLVVFLTSADRPFSESERAFLVRAHNYTHTFSVSAVIVAVAASACVCLVRYAHAACRVCHQTLLQQKIAEWHKKVVLVVNKIDILATQEDQAAVLEYVKANGRKLLGIEPAVFGVSARSALQAKLSNPDAAESKPRLWEASR